MLRLRQYIRPYYGFILLTVCIKLMGAALELLLPYLMEIMLDKKVPAGDLRAIYLYGFGMIGCALGCFGCNVLANRMSARSSGKITRSIRHDLFEKLQSLSARQLDKLTVSSAESRLTSDTYNVNQLLARLQRMGIRAPILLLGGIAMMLMMDASLALVLIGLLPVIGVVVYVVTKKSVPLYTRQQTALDKVVRVVQENITGIRVIKALSKTDYEKQRFHGVNEELSDIGLRSGMVTGATNPIATAVLRLGLTLVVLIGAFRVNNGTMDSGVIVAFLQYFIMILNAMLTVSRIFVMFSKGEASAKRVADVLETEQDLLVLPIPSPGECCRAQRILLSHACRGQAYLRKSGDREAVGVGMQQNKMDSAPHIEFRDVSFSYTGIGKNLENISFRLGRGQTLGILGPTGSGKSTIVNLLLRLYDPDEGQIRIDGQDIRTIPYEELRSKFGVVFQNDFIAEGAIRQNIDFFRALPEEALYRSAQYAQAEFIQTKEDGLDAEVVVRGNNLSGGQKQRLLIARALAANPEILVLDDAASALDYATDAKLRRDLAANYSATTTVLIAQRVSSLRHADLILYLSEGAILGMGTHSQLLSSCPEYRYLAETQMGEGKEGL